jgi:predicted Rossmann fold nucleotide-binding protein DprA/Smf involved in DNA uptake
MREVGDDIHLLLCLAPHVGHSTFDRVLNECRLRGIEPEELLRMSTDRLREEFRLRRDAARALTNGAKELRRRAHLLRQKVADKPVRLVTRESPLYPRTLDEFCPAPPGYLFLYGNPKVLNNPTFCVIASRGATREDLDRVGRIVEQQTLQGKTLVTGSNTPAYRAAAVVPLRWGAPRIVVVERGLFSALGDDLERELFPAARLWRHRFDPVTDLVISFSRPEEGAAKSDPARRDEIVVGLSQEVYAVRLRKGGNMERLAARAEERGRALVRSALLH